MARILYLTHWMILGLGTHFAFAQSTFEGWVCYEAQTSSSRFNIEVQGTDTLFIAPGRAINKSWRKSHLTDFGTTHQSWRYDVYINEEWRLMYSIRTRSPMLGEPIPARETIFPDSVEDFYRPQVEIERMDSVKTILGYPCRQAKVRLTFARADTAKPFERTIVVFYTSQLPNAKNIFKGLGGLPLEYWETVTDSARSGGFWERHLAVAISRGSVPTAYFNPRSLYPDVPVISQVSNGKPLVTDRLAKPTPLVPINPLRKSKRKPKFPWASKG